MSGSINPFDFWSGANFKLKIRKVSATEYDKSEFDSPSVLLDDDDKLESIYKNLNDLNEFTDLKNFKSYEDLKNVLTMFWVTVEFPRCKIKRLLKKNNSGT